MPKYFTRLGDGSKTMMSEAELWADLEAGTADAADRGKIEPLSREELKHIFDIITSPHRFVSVERGREVVFTYDASNLKTKRVGVTEDRVEALKIYEKFFGSDTADLGHVDYSYKPVKPILGDERVVLERALLETTIPITYGAMPNLGLYSQPDGPNPNPAELLPLGRIEEARGSYEDTVEMAVEDIVNVADAMYRSGADGINFDTTGAAGDPDFQAALRAAEKLKEMHPDICIINGMAGEMVLGMHGGLTYDGVRLAGLYPHQQVGLAEKAGAGIFGPVCNTNANRSTPWNLARAVTFMKACCEVAKIPVHVNMGMGVGAVTVNDHPPIDDVSRASKAMVEICRLDGL